MPFLDNDGVTRLTTDYLDVFARKEDAILDPSGGLIRTDDGISVDSLTRESDGAISGSIAELTAEGHAEQFSTTGKNLLPHVSSGESSNNGITFTSYGNGTYRFYGTATGGANLIFALSKGATLPSGELYVHMRNESIADSGVAFYVRTSKYSGNVLDAGFTNENRIVQIVGGSTITYIAVYVSTGKTVDVTFTPSIELTDILTDYEPYTGGAPSPSPDYPQEIQVVRGRNLLNESVYSMSGEVLASDGTTVASSNWNVSEYIPVNQGTYIFSTNVTGSAASYCLYDSSKTYVSGAAYANATTKVIEVPYGVAYIRVTYSNLDTAYSQLERGSTPTPYVPYGHVGLDTKMSPTMYKSSYGINQSGAESSNASFDIIRMSSQSGGVVSISGLQTAQTTRIHAYDVHGRWLAQALLKTGNGTLSFSVPNGTEELRISKHKDATITITSTTPIPLPSRGWVAGLPDGTADVLTLDGAGKCEWELNTWVSIVSLLPTVYTVNGVKGAVSDLPTSFIRTPMLCDRAQYILSNNAAKDTFYNNPSNIMMLGDSDDTINDLKTKYNGATILYHLATPVTEEAGYVDMPSIPVDCTVSIPELDALGVKYFVDNSAGTLARQWYERADDESDASIDQRIELVESNIAMIESTTAQSNHAVNSYFMLDNVLRKATSAIASGETISNSNSSPITVEQVVTALNNSVAALEKEVVFAITPSVSHRNIYRGKNLGTALTTAQKAQIAAGTFEDLYVGDYWTINGRVYRIADINYYYNSGDTAFTKNHLVIVPDASFGSDKMNDTNDTTGAYKGSKIYIDTSSVLNTARATIANDFGSALATHRIYLQNATTNGYASAGEWTDSTVDLMNEPMVYGSYIYTPAGNGSISPNRITVEKSQLALFRLNHRMINPGRYGYWLQDVVTGAGFAVADSGGNAGYLNASASRGVRPDFCIVGD